MDKIKLTGSSLQWFNGLALLGSFFGVRLVWGTYQSCQVMRDVWQSLDWSPSIAIALAESKAAEGSGLGAAPVVLAPETMRFVTETSGQSLWVAGAIIAANLTLNSLNYYWFIKMVEAVRKRFPGPDAKPKPDPVVKVQGTDVHGRELVPDYGAIGELRKRKS
jgi:hypothetical protein